MASIDKRVKRKIKLRRRQQTIIDVPTGGRVVFIGQPADGKPAVLIECPSDATVTHETLTPPVILP